MFALQQLGDTTPLQPAQAASALQDFLKLVPDTALGYDVVSNAATDTKLVTIDAGNHLVILNAAQQAALDAAAQVAGGVFASPEISADLQTRMAAVQATGIAQLNAFTLGKMSDVKAIANQFITTLGGSTVGGVGMSPTTKKKVMIGVGIGVGVAILGGIGFFFYKRHRS